MKNLDPDSCVENRALDGTLIVLAGILPTIAILVSMHSVIYPHWPCYLTSLLTPENWFFRILITSSWFWMVQGVWAIIGILLLILLIYICYAWLLLKELNCATNSFKPRWAISNFRDFKSVQIYYSQLQILHIAVMDILGILIVPLSSFSTNLILISNYTLIRHWEGINFIVVGMLLILSISCVSVVAVTFIVCAVVRENAVLALLSMKNFEWGSRRENKEMRMFVRARKAIGFGYGSMCLLTRKSVLKFLKCITRGTFRTLLAI